MIAVEAHSVTSSVSAMHPAVSMLPALSVGDHATGRPVSPRASSAEVLRPLLQITQALAGEIEPAKVYEAILRVVREVTGAQRISIQLLSAYAAEPVEEQETQLEAASGEPVLVLVAGLGLPAAARIGEARPVKQSVAAWVLENRLPLLLNGTSHSDPEIQRVMRASAPGMSALCVPLTAKGKVLGVLNASKEDAFNPFEETDRDFLAVLAGQAAISVEHARLYAQVARQAATDGLTGLLNFAAFHARLESELERAERTHQELSLLHLDLDGFKAVNDEYGHAAGDRLLKLMADGAVRDTIRPYDIASRPGGDEFSIILPHTTVEQAMEIAERLRSAVGTCDTRAIGVPTGTVAASIGIAHFPSDGATRDDLIEAADAALYHAKSQGRDRVHRGLTAITHVERDPRKLYDLLLDANTSTIEALAAAIDARDPYTAGHSRRVADCATELAVALGYQERFVQDLRLACLFHDVGKIGVPDAILQKPGKLTDDEFARMKDHARLGADMLDRVQSLQRALAGIRHHHERWDGRGYPDALAGDEIPAMARVIAVADAYDAMTSNRVYRAALLPEDVTRILRSGAGVQWDAVMVEKWVELLEQRAGGPALDETVDQPGLDAGVLVNG